MAIFITDRCIASALKKNDMEEAVRLFTDNNVREYLGGIISSHKAIEKLNQWISDHKSVYLTIRLKVNNEFIGIISISPHHNMGHHELSYQFLPEYWGYGYAVEIIEETLNYCKHKMHLKKIVAETQSANKRSCRLLERVGYQLSERIVRFDAEQSIYYYELL